tara:strand:+ start:120 stop:422 length:303 start_codon:yes stop_codon:yes gene_type:complete
MEDLEIGNKYLIPSGTRLWFINLQQSLITTQKYVIEVTHTVTTDDVSFFGDLYEVTFEGTALPGLYKILHGQTSSNLDIVQPLGNLLTPKDLNFDYGRLR